MMSCISGARSCAQPPGKAYQAWCVGRTHRCANRYAGLDRRTEKQPKPTPKALGPDRLMIRRSTRSTIAAMSAGSASTRPRSSKRQPPRRRQRYSQMIERSAGPQIDNMDRGGAVPARLRTAEAHRRYERRLTGGWAQKRLTVRRYRTHVDNGSPRARALLNSEASWLLAISIARKRSPRASAEIAGRRLRGGEPALYSWALKLGASRSRARRRVSECWPRSACSSG